MSENRSFSEIRILLPTDGTAIRQFECERGQSLDPAEFELRSWDEAWREESLHHYLPNGWCFGAFHNKTELVGYSLAQPLLYYRGLTQTLWVERLVAKEKLVMDQLFDVLVRWSRDKHLQSVIFNPHDEMMTGLLNQAKGASPQGPIWEIKTTKRR